MLVLRLRLLQRRRWWWLRRRAIGGDVREVDVVVVRWDCRRRVVLLWLMNQVAAMTPTKAAVYGDWDIPILTWKLHNFSL